MIKRLPEYCNQLPRMKYALNHSGQKYHIADNNRWYYLCDCMPSFRVKGCWKHPFSRVTIRTKFPWEPKE